MGMKFSFSDVLWFLFIVLALLPMWKQRGLEGMRIRLIRNLERKRGTRLITIIHRQEAISFLGIPISRYINVEDSEAVLRAIRLTPEDMPIDLLLHTPGGLVLAAEQIARSLQKHKTKVTVFVPHYAMSGGAMIALAADEIVMDENAVLGPVDPQLGNYPAVSIVETVHSKGIDRVDDQTLILADIATKAIRQVEDFISSLLEEKMSPEDSKKISRLLSGGSWTHDYPLTLEKLRDFGLKVQAGLPEEIYDLMDLYPQPPQRRPSVQYIPLPYDRDRQKR